MYSPSAMRSRKSQKNPGASDHTSVTIDEVSVLTPTLQKQRPNNMLKGASSTSQYWNHGSVPVWACGKYKLKFSSTDEIAVATKQLLRIPKTSKNAAASSTDSNGQNERPITDQKGINLYTSREFFKACKEIERTSRKHREKKNSIFYQRNLREL